MKLYKKKITFLLSGKGSNLLKILDTNLKKKIFHSHSIITNNTINKLMENSKFTIIGAGFVGMSMAATLAKYHQVKILDNDKIKVDLINASKSPLSEPLMEKKIVDYNQNISATTNFEEAISDANFIIISLPTNFDEVREMRHFCEFLNNSFFAFENHPMALLWLLHDQ